MSYNRGGYIGRAPSDSSVTVSKQYFEPTGAASTFTFSSGYDPGYIDVYRNGIKLVSPLDYSATNGSTIILSTPVGIGTTIEAVAYKSYNISNVEASTLETTCNGTNLILAGDLTVEGDIEYDEVIGRNVNLSGVTTTVGLNVTGIGTFVDINVSGAVTANAFVGDGSALTGIGVTQYTDTGSLVVAGISTFTGDVLVGSSATVGFGSTVFFKDGNKLYFGDGEDLSIYHDGSHSYIDDTGTGGIFVDASALTLRNANDENYAIFTSDGSADLYYNNSKKFETTNDGAVVTGIFTATSFSGSGSGLTGVASTDYIITGTAATFNNQVQVGTALTIGYAGVATFSGTGDVHLLDNVKLMAGDSSDLVIFHNGTNSVIRDEGAGNLSLQTNDSNVNIWNSTQSEYLAQFVGSGACTLYHDGSSKFQTTNDGTSTTGIATATIGIDAAIAVWTLGADGTSHYTFTGPGNLSGTNDPTLTLIRGQKYTFKNRSGGHPFRIQSTANGSAGTAYNSGVTNNDGGDGTNIIFDVPYDAPNVLYYQCTAHNNMGGKMYIGNSGQDIMVSAAATITGALTGSTGTFSGAVNIDATTDSTSTSTGALIVDGGLGVAKNVYIGAGLSVAGTLTYEDVTNVDSVGLITAKSGVNVSGGQVTIGTGITMGIAGVATFSGTSDIHLTDNVNLYLGDSKDSQILHTGSNFNLVNDTGHIFIQNDATANPDSNVYIRAKGGENSIVCADDGTVELYYDNDRKIKTISAGAQVESATGDTNFIVMAEEDDSSADALLTARVTNDSASSYVMFGDGSDANVGKIRYNHSVDDMLFYTNDTEKWRITSAGNLQNNSDSGKLQLGVSEDLEIFHDGSNSYIKEAGTGNVIHEVTDATIEFKKGGSEHLAKFIPDGAVELYYNNSKKIETTNDGTVTTGIATATGGLDINADSKYLRIGASGDLQLYHDGSNSYIKEQGTGQLIIDGEAVILQYGSSSKLNTTNDGVVITGICTDSKGDVRSIPRNAQSSNYTLVASDAGKHIYTNNAPTITVPPDVFQGGDAVTIINASTSDMSINQGTGVSLYMPGGAEANCTLGKYGICTLLLSVSNVWWISGAELSQ